MARYIARFMKDVLGENGHGAEICQRSIEIEASSPRHAAELAKIQFCESENVKDWFFMLIVFTLPTLNFRLRTR